MIRRTFRPAISPASLVAWRWCVVEVRRDGDHRIGDRLAQVLLGVPLELLQHPGGDLLRGVLLAVDLDGPVGAHMPLDRPDGPLDVGHRLPLRDLADQRLPGLGEGDHGRGGAATLGVRDDGGLATLQNGDDGVRRAEVDADRSCHLVQRPFTTSTTP